MSLAQIVADAVPIVSRIRSGELTEGEVKRTLDAMIMHVLAAFSLSGTMNDIQVELCVNDIYEKFPSEALEDFALVFKRARQGEFGTVYRIDQAVIFGWIHAYLETKAQAREQMPREKPFTLADLPDDKLEEIKRAVQDAPMSRASVPMTKDDVKREGQVRQPRQEGKYHPSTTADDVRLIDLKTEYARLHTDLYSGKVLDGHPDFETWLKEQ